jgi:type 1 glutamine amidotransferase
MRRCCTQAPAVALAILAAAGCGSSATPSPSPSGSAAGPVRVLLFTATAGFRHDSIATARQTMSSMASSSGEFVVTTSEDVTDLGQARLAQFDVLMFGMTTGELPLNAEQKTAVLAFVNGGRGFIGTHSATDTLYTWPEYGELVGAYFKEHPWTQIATVTVEDRAHPTTAGLGASFQINEEFYTFRENPRPNVHVLLSLDTASVGAAGDHPLAWTRSVGAGRMYYTALGHFPATWTDSGFQAQIRAAVKWVAGR